ncbi:MAG: hypothetical protein II143_07005 [Bacteroidales bacterium]|nr:hypothetical protein [Bacteroidales bacterium]
MKPLYLFATILLATLAAACNGGGEGDGKKTDRQIWVHEKPLVAMVEVSSGGSVIETYEYTYDEQGRILTLVKTDKLAREVVLDLNYSYSGENEMKVQGKFFPIATNRYIDVSYNPTSGTLSYKGSWSGAWSYTTSVNKDGVVTSTECQSDFAAKEGYYTSKMNYSEVYTISEGTVTESVIGTEINAQSSKATRTANVSALKTTYTPGGQDDRQNFAAYLMPDNFPVWIAAGFPGNKKLITGISASTGTIPAPETTAIEYSFNAAGDIDTATRTDSNAGTPYLTRTYKFIYQ